MLRLHAFGGCALTRDGERLDALAGQRKGLALLALLAAADARGVSRETLLAFLWPESDQERARLSLNQLVHSLRQQLRTPDLLAASPTLRLNPARMTSDVADFRAALRRDDSETAVGLYAGPFLDGLYLKGADEFERWTATERAALARDAGRALEALAERASARGEVRAAVEWWRRLATAEPLSGRAAAGLVRALVAAGDRAAAVQHARHYERQRREELGGPPDPAISALLAELQQAAQHAPGGAVGAVGARGPLAAPPPAPPPATAEANERYLRGRHLASTRITEDGLRLALKSFREAVALDPANARAHAGMSDAYAYLGIIGHGRAHEEFAAAKAAARTALALNDGLAEAHVALAHVLFLLDFAWEEAERAFRQAIHLDPANVAAHVLFAICLQDLGRFDEAIAELETARAREPLSVLVGNVLGRVHVNARRPDAAIAHLRAVLELAPQEDLAYQQLGHAYLQQGMRAEAVAALRQAAALSGARDAAHLAYACAVTGDADEARRILAERCDPARHPDLSPFHLAMAHAGLGDADRAFALLERGVAERAAFMDGVAVTPAFDGLRGDPRWPTLLRRMRLAP